MCAVIGFSKANKVGSPLRGFKMQKILSLGFTNSRYLIYGKVVLDNTDGDPQNASVQLRTQDGESFVTLDETSVRLLGEGDPNRTEVSVQVGIEFDAPTTVELACATFDGNASQAQLAAIQLDFLNGVPR